MKCAIYTQAYDSPECFVENHKFSSVYSAFSIFSSFKFCYSVIL